MSKRILYKVMAGIPMNDNEIICRGCGFAKSVSEFRPHRFTCLTCELEIDFKKDQHERRHRVVY